MTEERLKILQQVRVEFGRLSSVEECVAIDSRTIEGLLMYLRSRTTHRSGRRGDLIVADLPLVRVNVGGIVPLAVPQSNVGFGLGLLLIQRLVQVLVDEMILRALLATDVAAGWHADQMHLVHNTEEI